MEKYCPKCHKIYNDMKAKFCTNCATELLTRKQEPHPNEAEYQIQIKNKKKELSDLQNQLHDAENKLKDATDEDEILEYKFIIKKLKNENIPNMKKELDRLTQEEKKIKSEIKKQQEENNRRERLFKKLYVELDGELLKEICDYFSLKEPTTEDNLRLLVNNYSEEEIYNKIKIEEQKRIEAEEKRKQNKTRGKKCPYCGYDNPKSLNKCWSCGKELNSYFSSGKKKSSDSYSYSKDKNIKPKQNKTRGKKCPYCGYDNPKSLKKCWSCGKELNYYFSHGNKSKKIKIAYPDKLNRKKNCPRCGKRIPIDKKICPACNGKI